MKNFRHLPIPAFVIASAVACADTPAGLPPGRVADSIGSDFNAQLHDVMSGSHTEGDIDGKKHMEKTAKKVDELVEEAKAHFKSGFTVKAETVEDGNLRITVSAADQKKKLNLEK